MRGVLSLPYVLLTKMLSSRVGTAITSNSLKTSFVLIFITVFWHFPSYDVLSLQQDKSARAMRHNWDAIFLQSKEPFTNHVNLYAVGSHEEKLAFRFVPAVILGLLHIDTLKSALIFQFFTLMFFYLLLVSLFRKLFEDRIKTFVYILPICFVVSGHVYCYDYMGIFDTLALDFLLLALIFRKSEFSIICLLLSYFTDERAIVASVAIFLINLVDRNSFANTKSVVKGLFFRTNIFLISSWIAYLIVRYLLGKICELRVGTGRVDYFFEQIHRTFYTIYIGLEGFLIPFALVVLMLFRKHIYSFTGLILLAYVVICFVSQSVIDIARSMSYILPLLILILLLFDKYYSREKVFKIITWVVVISLLYDHCFPMFAQLYRMKFMTHTI